jgi:hypothetical protein
MRKMKEAGGAMKVSGNPKVIKAAKGKKDGGKVIGLMTGGAVTPRMDRPGRKMGGRVGADRSPLSSAHRSTSAPKA